MMNRRTLLKFLAGGVAATWLPRAAWAAAGDPSADYFIIVHAGGGWDVTLWADPRNERHGLVEPPSTGVLETGRLKHWKNAPLADGLQTFEILEPSGSALRLGPALGDLYDLRDRITIVNGIAVNTVSHDDGIVFATTGRHRSGGLVPAPSIDAVLASELGATQRMPDVSIKFPSSVNGAKLDPRASPMRVNGVEAVTGALSRSSRILDADDRAAIAALAANEARDLAVRTLVPDVFDELASEQDALPALLSSDLVQGLSPAQLARTYPQLDGLVGQRAAFALEAIRHDLVRCVAFTAGGLDTHTTNYRGHALTLQGLFDSLAALVRLLDTTPHPTLHDTRLSERTHILVVSEFCRAPQINLAGGRDHYPNNSALVISPRFRGGRSFGRTDTEQLLPAGGFALTGGTRVLTPADVLATFLGAFGVDPRRFMRDGEVVRELLA
jgi:uncharacterized protein (DUF1501 family)